MTHWPGPPLCKLQGSLVCLDEFTLRIIDDPTGPGAASSDLTVGEGETFDNVDAFLNLWQNQIQADTGEAYALEVVTSGSDKGKIKITSGGNNITLAWHVAGDAGEAERWYAHLGATAATTTNTPSPLTLPNPHKAGWYPSLAPRTLERAAVGYGRGQGVSLSTASWAQCDPVLGDFGNLSVDVELQIDGSADWAELWELAIFFDDVFDRMGEPWSIINVPADDTTGDYWSGYVAQAPFEIIGERAHRGWNGLLTVAVRMDGAHAPHVDD